MVLAVEQILTLYSEAMHLRPGAHPSDRTMGAEYQRISGIQLPGDCHRHVLIVESVAGFVAPVLVVVSARFLKP